MSPVVIENAIPNIALCILRQTGEVIAVEARQSCFFRTSYGIRSQEYVDLLNRGIGVNPSQAQAMNLCAITGKWNDYQSIVEYLENNDASTS